MMVTQLETKTKTKIEAIINRTKTFYAAVEPGHFMVRVTFPVNAPKVPDLRTIDMDRDKERFLKSWLDMHRATWVMKEDIDDDDAPTIFPRYGIAEHSAWLGQEVVAQEDTNYPVEIMTSASDIDKLNVSEKTPWYKHMEESYQILKSMQDGTFVLATRGIMTPMELGNMLRGNDIFLDFMLHPDDVHKLMDFLTNALQWYYKKILSWSNIIEGGTFSSYAYGWAEHCMGHISNDTALMCHPSTYETFGLPYEQKLVDGYKSVIYHSHSAGLQFLNQLSNLSNLKLLEISEDPNAPKPIESLDIIFEKTAGISHLMIHGTAQQFRGNIEKLKERNVLCDVICADKNEAKEMVDFIRQHSKAN